MKISDLIPDAEIMLRLSPQELGCALLKVIDSLPEAQRHRGNYLRLPEATSDYPQQYHQQLKGAQSETWEWLRSSGYISPRTDASDPEFIYVTRRGRDYLKDCSSQAAPSTAMPGGTVTEGKPVEPKPGNETMSLGTAYQRVRAWYRDNISRVSEFGLAPLQSSQVMALSGSLSESMTPLEMRAVLHEVVEGLLDWGARESDGTMRMVDYAKAGLNASGGESFTEEERIELRATSGLWRTLMFDYHKRPGEDREDGYLEIAGRWEPRQISSAALGFRPEVESIPPAEVPQEDEGESTITRPRVPSAKDRGFTVRTKKDSGAHLDPDVGNLVATSNDVIISDQWVTDDSLGYEPYARALANLITHPDTLPPLTIGIEAPWGAGKTSIMKMIQYLIDGQAELTEQNRAGQFNRPAESSITLRRLLDALRHPNRVTEINPVQSERGKKYDIPGRATVWFNAWKYQTSEQVWAGLAHCIINHVTVRMSPEARELFWLKLNSRRVDVAKVRRKVYETVLQDLLPTIVGWAIALILLLFLLVAINVIGAASPNSWLGMGLHWVCPLASVGAGIHIWISWRQSLTIKLGEKARGDLLSLVREPDYEGKMGFLYLVESDIREVLQLVSRPKTPLVIFIDDLDRCLPHKVAEVVEAVSLFLAGDYPNCIFVMGMEPRVVAAALEVANSDLINRMRQLGFEDECAPLGWRFMEKIVQLPLVLPPPTKIGMVGYLNSLAAPSGVEPLPHPNETAVRAYVDSLAKEATLSDVVEQTENLIFGKSKPEVQAIAEASKRVFSRKFDRQDPLVRKFLDSAVEVFGANPRQVKRYINLFRLCCNIRHSIWLDSRAGNEIPDLPSDEQITKFVVFSVHWPQATALLREMPTRDFGAETEADSSVLALLERYAVQVEEEGENADAKWLAMLTASKLPLGEWGKTPRFRRHLAKKGSMSDAANKGLW